MKALVARDGTDIHPRDNFGRTPLAYATKFQHIEVMKVLLTEDGISVDLEIKISLEPRV